MIIERYLEQIFFAGIQSERYLEHIYTKLDAKCSQIQVIGCVRTINLPNGHPYFQVRVSAFPSLKARVAEFVPGRGFAHSPM